MSHAGRRLLARIGTGLLLLAGARIAAAPPEPEPERVAQARRLRTEALRAAFAAQKVAYPPGEIYLRAFKLQDQLELWAGPKGAPLTLIRTYAVCARSGDIGPKRRQGDGQVPEGFYVVDRFNPQSAFHLSLGLDYPNERDRRAGQGARLGGDIFIHGSCVTIGCLPIEDGPIEELYVLALDTRANGQKRIPVHVFPDRMPPDALARLRPLAKGDASLVRFWESLVPGYEHFERTRRPPRITVDGKTGEYRVAK